MMSSYFDCKQTVLFLTLFNLNLKVVHLQLSVNILIYIFINPPKYIFFKYSLMMLVKIPEIKQYILLYKLGTKSH